MCFLLKVGFVLSQYFCGDLSSGPSSVLGMSKISANNGGSRMCVQLVRNQSKCDTCIAPSARNSAIFASSAGIIWRALLDPGRVRTICTRNASATRSRHLVNRLWLMEPRRLLLLVIRTSAQKRPISMSLRPNILMLLAKLTKADEKPFCEMRPINTIKFDITGTNNLNFMRIC